MKRGRYSFKSKGRIEAGKKLQRLLRKNKKLRTKRIRQINIAYKNPEYRKKLSRIKKKFYKNPEERQKIDRIITEYYREHPNMRKELAQRAINYFKNNPKAFQKFLKAGKNPLRKHLNTKQGELVRSKGEKAIADYLYKNKIAYKYEGKTLSLGDYLCTPDFLLLKQKIYIEFYGGYPGSWKKKVLKNKLYPKYKIPVISITPSELEDLDKDLKRYINQKRVK
jgi:hypothetical protein